MARTGTANTNPFAGRKTADQMPKKGSGRHNQLLDDFAAEVEALKLETPDKVYIYEDFDRPAAFAQAVKNRYGIVAGSRDVDKDTHKGTLVVQNRAVTPGADDEEYDDNYDDTSEDAS